MYAYKQTDGQTDKQTDRQTDRDRKIETETKRDRERERKKGGCGGDKGDTGMGSRLNYDHSEWEICNLFKIHFLMRTTRTAVTDHQVSYDRAHAKYPRRYNLVLTSRSTLPLR